MWHAFGPTEMPLSLQTKPQHLTQKPQETTDQKFFCKPNITEEESIPNFH